MVCGPIRCEINWCWLCRAVLIDGSSTPAHYADWNWLGCRGQQFSSDTGCCTMFRSCPTTGGASADDRRVPWPFVASAFDVAAGTCLSLNSCASAGASYAASSCSHSSWSSLLCASVHTGLLRAACCAEPSLTMAALPRRLRWSYPYALGYNRGVRSLRVADRSDLHRWAVRPDLTV
jgi:hypothetical protein